jgi:hypothetical protein
VDGNNHQIDTARALAATRSRKITTLIDLLHVMGYLWKAADTFFYKGDPTARVWVRAQTDKLLSGLLHECVMTLLASNAGFGWRGGFVMGSCGG